MSSSDSVVRVKLIFVDSLYNVICELYLTRSCPLQTTPLSHGGALFNVSMLNEVKHAIEVCHPKHDIITSQRRPPEDITSGLVFDEECVLLSPLAYMEGVGAPRARTGLPGFGP